jgi:hypothetical protein
LLAQLSENHLQETYVPFNKVTQPYHVCLIRNFNIRELQAFRRVMSRPLTHY